MKNSTLCYIEDSGKYLLLHRVKKENDENKDKWIGVGGKLEENESPHDCIRREIKEETGLTALELKYRGLVTFISDIYETEQMHLFTASGYIGEINYQCDEGELCWVEKEKIASLNIWEGDKIFFRLLDSRDDFFSLKLVYRGDELIDHVIE